MLGSSSSVRALALICVCGLFLPSLGKLVLGAETQVDPNDVGAVRAAEAAVTFVNTHSTEQTGADVKLDAILSASKQVSNGVTWNLVIRVTGNENALLHYAVNILEHKGGFKLNGVVPATLSVDGTQAVVTRRRTQATPGLPGGWTPANPTDIAVMAAARAGIRQYSANTSADYIFKDVLSGTSQVANGINYNLTVAAQSPGGADVGIDMVVRLAPGAPPTYTLVSASAPRPLPAGFQPAPYVDPLAKFTAGRTPSPAPAPTPARTPSPSPSPIPSPIPSPTGTKVPPVVGGLSPASPTDPNVVAAAEKAVELFNAEKGTNCQYKDVAQAQTQVVAGVKYDLTIDMTGCPYPQMRAEIVNQPWNNANPWQLVSTTTPAVDPTVPIVPPFPKGKGKGKASPPPPSPTAMPPMSPDMPPMGADMPPMGADMPPMTTTPPATTSTPTTPTTPAPPRTPSALTPVGGYFTTVPADPQDPTLLNAAQNAVNFINTNTNKGAPCVFSNISDAQTQEAAGTAYYMIVGVTGCDWPYLTAVLTYQPWLDQPYVLFQIILPPANSTVAPAPPSIIPNPTPAPVSGFDQLPTDDPGAVEAGKAGVSLLNELVDISCDFQGLSNAQKQGDKYYITIEAINCPWGVISTEVINDPETGYKLGMVTPPPVGGMALTPISPGDAANPTENPALESPEMMMPPVPKGKGKGKAANPTENPDPLGESAGALM